jgi:hypothetical protein
MAFDVWLNSIFEVTATAVLTFLGAIYWTQRKARMLAAEELAKERQKGLDRITELELKLALISQTVVPINLAMQAMLIKELTHYHTQEMDELLVKVGPPNILTEVEEARLSVMLVERTADMGPLISPRERDAAVILPIIMKRAKDESETLLAAEQMKVQLITVAAVIGVPINIGFNEVNIDEKKPIAKE